MNIGRYWMALAGIVSASVLFAHDAPAENFVFVSPEGAWQTVNDADIHGACAFAGAAVNPAKVVSAVAEVTALGCFEFFVNGKLVSDSEGGNRSDFMRPGFTDAHRRRAFHRYDVTSFWRTAAGVTNALSAFVAPSWFSDTLGARPDVKPAFGARVTVRCADGSVKTFATGRDWTASFKTPFVRAGIYGGEIYDARIPADAAALAGSTPAEVNTNFTGVVSLTEGAEVSLRRDLALKPVRAHVYSHVAGAEGTNAFGRVVVEREYGAGEPMRLEKGETLVVDFGQNAAAVPEIVASAAAGVELTFKGGEMLNDANGERARGNDGPAGSVYFANLRSLRDDRGALVRYVFAGRGDERYMPSFTFLGYRYAQIRATGAVTIRSLLSVPVTSVRRSQERGTIRTGRDDVNRLISNCVWGLYSNYLSIPTDCPQRDERMGWSADTQVFAAAAMRTADAYAFLSKWMTDMRDGQADGRFPSVAPLSRWGDCGRNRLGWADAGVIVPWTCWRATGDKTIVERNWDAMQAFVATQEANRFASVEDFQYGDWLAYERVNGNYWDEHGLTKEAVRYWDYLGGCYWYWNARRMREMAELLGKTEDVKRYDAMTKKARRYLKTYFFDDEGALVPQFRQLQTAHLFALHLGLYDTETARMQAIGRLKRNFAEHDNCLQTGFLGTSILMDAVTYGAESPELAYTLLLQHRNPSWLYSVDQGATTVWERWNSYVKDTGFGDVGMNSFNHYAYGCVLDWLYGTAAGIRPGPNGGYDEFVLAPIPDERLGSVEAAYRTAKGVIRSAWKYENGVCNWRFTVPAGSRAIVRTKGTESTYGPGEHALALDVVERTRQVKDAHGNYVSQRPASAQRLFRSAAVDAKIAEVCGKLKNPKLAWLFENCFPNTLDTTVSYSRLANGDDDTFVYTGDIHAMWLRDSGAQVWPYLKLIRGDEPLRRLVRGVILRQFACIRLDPYANAFNIGPTGEGHVTDEPRIRKEVFERKYELDSLCYPIRLAHGYWNASGDATVFDARWIETFDLVLATMRKQQRKTPDANDFRFRRQKGDFREHIQLKTGWPAKPCGLIASAFRPSDDACVLPFLVPSNFFAVDVLRKAEEILRTVNRDAERADAAGALANEVEAALRKHAVVRHPVCGDVYAFEVDGYGSALLMDDANVPSLLALPYFSGVKRDDPVYRNTRRLVWSANNPFFFSGKAGEGVGGPHCGLDTIWPMSGVLMAITSDDDDEIVRCLKAVVASDAETGFMHESHHKDDVNRFTRSWFAWANTLFGELVAKLADEGRLDLLDAVK